MLRLRPRAHALRRNGIYWQRLPCRPLSCCSERSSRVLRLLAIGGCHSGWDECDGHDAHAEEVSFLPRLCDGRCCCLMSSWSHPRHMLRSLLRTLRLLWEVLLSALCRTEAIPHRA